MRSALLVTILCFASGACSADSAGADASPAADSASTGEDTALHIEPATDGASSADSAGPFTSIVGGAECSTRTDACDDSDPSRDSARAGVQRITQDCLTAVAPVWTCGTIDVDLDALGCARGFRLEKPKDEVTKCIAERLATVRFACAPGTEVSSIVDSCTIK